MKIPEKIKLFATTYKIVKDKNKFNEFAMAFDNSSAYGFADIKDERLLLANDLSPGMERKVSWHEVGHAIYWEAGLTTLFNEEQEELIVTAFANGYFQIVRQNPEYIDYIQEED